MRAAAAARGVDIIQNCPVTAIRRGPDGRVTGVETAKGFIAAKKVAVSAAGHLGGDGDGGRAAAARILPAAGACAGTDQADLPLRRHVERGLHAYVSQSDKGELVIGSHRPVCQLFPARRPAADQHTLAAICGSSRSSAGCGC